MSNPLMEQSCFFFQAEDGIRDRTVTGVQTCALPISIILGALLIGRPRIGRSEEKGSWAAVQAMRPLPEALRKARLVRHLGAIVAVLALGVALVVPAFTTNANSLTITGIFAFAIAGLSVGVVTGLGGQLSLGQFALAGVGALIA